MTKKRLAADPEFVRWAKRATAGIDQSRAMIGVMNDPADSAERLEFALQIGHSLLAGKPLGFVAPYGADLPKKLKAAATYIGYYDPDNEESFRRATREVAEALGQPVRH